MSWLHPGILGWCALGVAPFLLHWILRDRIKRVLFGGTRFLGNKELASAARKHWLENLLLLLRAALLVLLVVAFARPFFANHPGTRPLTIVLLDCSRAMQVGGRFARAKSECEDVLAHLPSGEQVMVAAIGDAGVEGLEPANSISDARRHRLDQLHPGGGGAANVLGGLELAAERCGTQPCAIHLVSVLQSEGFPSTQRSAHLPASAHLVIHDVAQPTDAPSESVRMTAQLEGGELTPGDGNVVVATRVVNRGSDRRITLALKSGDKALDSRTIELPQDGTASVTLRGSLTEVGDFPCTVTADGVPTILPDDATSRLVAHVLRQVHIAIVDGKPSDDHAQDPAFFIAAALSAGAAKRYAIDVVREIPSLGAYQAVVLACPERIAPADTSRLGGFVQAGGGLLILLGPGLDPDRINPALEALAPARVRSWHVGDVSLSVDAAGAAMFSRILGDRGDNLSIASFSGSAELKDSAGAHVLLRFNDQRPALLYDHRGQGVTMLFADAFDRRVGDFPLRPLFLPLVAEMVRALHAEGDSGGALATGADLALSPGDRLLGSPGALVADAAGHIRASEPGFYRRIHDGQEQLLAVNSDPRASDPVLLLPDDVQRLLTDQSQGIQATSNGLERVLAPDEVRQAEARLGLGRWCLGLVAALLVTELFLAQSISRR